MNNESSAFGYLLVDPCKCKTSSQFHCRESAVHDSLLRLYEVREDRL